MYFGPNEEDLVLKYLETGDSDFYAEKIDPLFEKLLYGVRKRYNFQPKRIFLDDAVINDCKSLMWEKLTTNFNTSFHKKSYSYLTRVAHNFFCKIHRDLKKEERQRSEFELIYYSWNMNLNFYPSIEHLCIEQENRSAYKTIIDDYLVNYLKIADSMSRVTVEELVSMGKFKKVDIFDFLISRLGLEEERRVVAVKRMYRGRSRFKRRMKDV